MFPHIQAQNGDALVIHNCLPNATAAFGQSLQHNMESKLLEEI